MSAHTIEAILTARDQGFTKTFDNAVGKAESFGEKLKSGLGFGMWMAIGQKAVSTVFNLINSSIDGAVKRFDTLNNYPKVMQSLGFSAEEAEASIDALGKGIEFLPTTLDKVSSQTQQFVAITGDIGKATKLTLALNNAMASGGQSAEQQASAINQWSQAMAKGKPDLQDWRALVQTAPAQMNQLAEAVLGAGKSQSDLYEAMKSGKVTIDEVNDAMIRLSEEGGDGFASWAEQAKSASAGIQMSIGNVKASVQRNLANIMGGIDDMLADFGGISGVIQSVVPMFDSLGEAITSVISGDVTIGDAVSSILGKIGELAKQFVPKGIEMMANLIGGFLQQLPQMLVAGLEAITSLIQGLDSGNGKLTGKIIKIAGNIVKAFIKALPSLLVAGGRLILALLRGVINTAGQLLSYVLGLGKKIVQKIKTGLGNLAGIGKDLIQGLWKGIKEKFDGVVEKVKGLAKKLPTAVKKVLGIASPSKVMYKLGEYTGEGLALGIESMSRAVEVASLGLASVPSAKMRSLAVDGAYTYGTTANYTIEVPLYVNGREFAKATAGDMQSEMRSMDTHRQRLRGIK